MVAPLSLVRPERRLAGAVLGRLVPHALARVAQRVAAGGPFIRGVNYHATPERDAANFRRQLAWYRRHYSNVTYEDLEAFLSRGIWTKPKPGLLLSFDDGYRDNATVAAPLLEEFGFTGWFFVPSRFALEGHDGAGGNQPPNPCMTRDQLRSLATRHVVGCHTQSHFRLRASAGAERLRREVIDAKAELEGVLGRAVTTFCWVGGEEDTYSAEAARFVEEAGYRFGFMTNPVPMTTRTHPLELQRANVEADYPLALVNFQLMGLMDILYIPKRRRVNTLTHGVPQASGATR